jgi:class 3 adenylate cyclase
MYTRFDNIIKKYKHIQKIETIGDAYMVVGDMNNFHYNNELLIEMISFALEILNEVKKIKTPTHVLSIRIGIHYGSFIVSYIGKINPRLCVIGKHVNKTARLQSTAEIDTIQISKEIYNLLDKNHVCFNCSLNKDIYLKNIGTVDTYTIRK